jgi:hypothetical protein
VRAWDAVVEKAPCVFHVRRQPFLHFHLLEGGRRRADVKGRGGWTPVELPRPITAASRRALVRELERRYRERAGGSPGDGLRRAGALRPGRMRGGDRSPGSNRPGGR